MDPQITISLSHWKLIQQLVSNTHSFYCAELLSIERSLVNMKAAMSHKSPAKIILL